MSTEWTDIRNEESPARLPDEFVGARFWIRVGARILDWGVHYAVWLTASLLFGFGVGLYAAIARYDLGPVLQKLSNRPWYFYVFSALGLLFYHTVMEGMCGSTLGKRLLGLVVISSDGKAVSLRAALGRSLAFYVDGLFFGLPAYDSMEPPLQQRLGDKWCGHTCRETIDSLKRKSRCEPYLCCDSLSGVARRCDMLRLGDERRTCVTAGCGGAL